MRRKHRIKRVAWILISPVLLFVLLILSLYIPPVQDHLREKTLNYLSETLDMEVDVRRIDLRFPFNFWIRDVRVIHPADTLLTLNGINVRMQLLPLLRGQVKVQGITLQGATLNSADLIPGIQVKGKIGRFFVRSNKIDLSKKTMMSDRAEMSSAQIHLYVGDTIPTKEKNVEDTTTLAVDWYLMLHSLKLKNVSFDMQQPADSLLLSTHIETAAFGDMEADLGKQLYSLKTFMLNASSVHYDVGQTTGKSGFDPSHITLQDIRMELDSLVSQGKNLHAGFRKFSMQEQRSGLQIASLRGHVHTDSFMVYVPDLFLSTPYSAIKLNAQFPWDEASREVDNTLSAHFDVHIGKQDVMPFTTGLPRSFNDLYPDRLFTMQGDIAGSLNAIRISAISAELPTAFSLQGMGELRHLESHSNRSGNIDLQMQTQNLGFLAKLISEDSFVFPENMTLTTKAIIKGEQYDATLRLKEDEGILQLNAGYNTSTEAYHAELTVNALHVNHFLPLDSVCNITTTFEAEGEKTDFLSPRASAFFKASVDNLHYGKFQFSSIHIDGHLKEATAAFRLTSDNPLLVMSADATYQLNSPQYTRAKVNMNVLQVNLYKAGIISQPLKRPVAFTLDAETRSDSLKLSLTAGDMSCRFRAPCTLEQFMEKSTHIARLLSNQIENRTLDHKELRQALPSARLVIRAGKNNPFSQFLEMKNISYDNLMVGFMATDSLGINGRAYVNALKIDTLLLDTISLAIKQDTTHVSIQGGITNNKRNPYLVFKSSLKGEIRSDDAELMVAYENEKGETGMLLGVNMRPVRKAMQFRIIPEDPVIAFRKFHINEHNRVFIRDDLHVIADVEILDKEGMGIRVHSIRDSLSLQNLDIELRKIRLAEFSNLPYMPQLTGELSAEANFRQTASSRQFSVEASLAGLTYERRQVGDIRFGFTWAPHEEEKHYVSTYVTYENKEIASANGVFGDKSQDYIGAEVALNGFPLHIVDAFIPEGMVTLSGNVNGELRIGGTLFKPQFNGNIKFDETTVNSHLYNVRFNLDKRPLQIKDNRLLFEDFAIYTVHNQNPFTIKGNVDFRDSSHPAADLLMRANNYVLLDARYSPKTLLYGKVAVDVNSTLKGPLEALVMRGSMTVRGNTDVTYVLTDSPLTVQDRLGDLVTFTSFSDTLSHPKENIRPASLIGLDMLMTVHIDQAVRVKADLSADRSSRIEFEGGGDLSFQYTPQGNISLIGRYALIGGIIKYSLPVIPLKEFKIKNGSYVEWTGNPIDPKLELKATERLRASVSQNDGSSRMVAFDVSMEIKNRLEALSLNFNLEAPEDMTIQNQLILMTAEEQNKQAIAMLVTGTYLASGTGTGLKDFLDMDNTLNTVLVSQLSNFLGSAWSKSGLTLGVDKDDNNVTGGKYNYSFRYSHRFFNDRFQVAVGARMSTDKNTNQVESFVNSFVDNMSSFSSLESFIDNISLEYRLDSSGTRYIRLYYNKNFDGLLEGEITETGLGIVLRKKVNRLKDLFIF
ncbi:hypothetical protein EZS27_006842 [termite gut metagenome]|uniref:Translocation and assembly module TamB C-terminal domain-containing protein n=1 Tax=termite gut metagenome TaxID=433724 RepID=A0A5J4SIK4_9ZZZZ